MRCQDADCEGRCIEMKIFFPVLKSDYGIASRGESLERALFLPALQKTGCDVIPFWLEEHGFPSDLVNLQHALVQEARAVKPDLIFFILMESEITLDTLRLLSSEFATLNWFADDQWRFESFTSKISPALKYAVTVDKYSVDKYKALGFQKVIRSQWGCSAVEEAEARNGQFQYEVSFVGGWNSVRQWYVDSLKAAGVPVTCFGSGWPGGRLSFEGVKRVFRTSKISLNLSNSQPDGRIYIRYLFKMLVRAVFGFERRSGGYLSSLRRVLSGVHSYFVSQKRTESIKARNFEIPAWGGFQISQFALEIDEYFVPGKEIVLFSTPQELVTLVRYYLRNDEEREAIYKAGAQRASEHTYDRRMQDIVEWVKNDSGNA